MNAEIEAALAIARERHTAVTSDDLDRYFELDEALGAACSVLVRERAEALTANDIPALDELIGLETQSREVLQRLMAEISARLDSLRAGTRANGAYWASERFSVNPA